MKKLLIVESPTKARTVGHYLGKEYEVLASVGHVRDLPKSNKDAVDIEAGFVPRYVVSPGKQEVIERIKREALKASEVYLATDPDREGEAIAWHIKEAAGLAHPKRVVFHEITKEAIEEALAQPRDVDENLRRAQEARRVLDRIVGYDLSGLIWKKVRYGLSAGRVQSPALRILAEREREIKAFIPETFFVLTANLRAKAGEFSAVCAEQPKTREEAERILAAGKKAAWTVARIEENEEARAPQPPFTTSTLQQSASTRLGFSPSRAMRAAQKLYEAGHITYMRTDSVNLAKEAVARMLGVVEQEFGKNYAQARLYKTTSKNAQEAHEAIRPTDSAKQQAGATPDEERIYELIRTRALASQMASARVLRTSVSAKADADIPLFSANGSRVLFPGWLALDTRARGEDVELPKLALGEALKLLSLAEDEKQTEPPKRYSEAGLIKELEKRGIGRPSTYASIMKTILDRGYVELQSRALVPTATGMVVSGWLETNFSEYISDTFTAEMEDELDEIARGERGYEKTLKDFYGPFEKAVKSKNKLPKATSLGDAPAKFPCPVCGGPMEFKLGRGGVFMSCKRYPECTGARQEDGTELKPDEPIGTHPETGAPIYIRTGRFGPYVEMVNGGDTKKNKRASLPQGANPGEVTLTDALKYLSLPRELGKDPATGERVVAAIGRFGPYVGRLPDDKKKKSDFRSIKTGDPYTITLPEALALLAEPKKKNRGSPRGEPRKSKKSS